MRSLSHTHTHTVFETEIVRQPFNLIYLINLNILYIRSDSFKLVDFRFDSQIQLDWQSNRMN